jgi:hypothetical protein
MAVGDPYASLSALKAYMGFTGQAEDAELELALYTATSDIEEHCRRTFWDSGSVTTREYQVHNRRRVLVDDFNTLTGLVVKVGSKTEGYDTTWTINEDFFVSPEGGRIHGRDYSVWWRIHPKGRALTVSDEPTMEVSARWGWAAVPVPVQKACRLWAARLFRRSDSPEGVIGGYADGPIRVGYMMDPDIAKALAPFRKHVDGVPI